METSTQTYIILYQIGKETRAWILKIGYIDKRLEKLCLVKKFADRTLGADCGKKLRTRLSEIDAASNVRELVAGRPHPLSGDREGQFSLNLSGGKRLVFKSESQPAPVLIDGGIDWSKVEAITVVFIGDYHD